MYQLIDILLNNKKTTQFVFFFSGLNIVVLMISWYLYKILKKYILLFVSSISSISISSIDILD